MKKRIHLTEEIVEACKVKTDCCMEEVLQKSDFLKFVVTNDSGSKIPPVSNMRAVTCDLRCSSNVRAPQHKTSQKNVLEPEKASHPSKPVTYFSA